MVVKIPTRPSVLVIQFVLLFCFGVFFCFVVPFFYDLAKRASYTTTRHATHPAQTNVYANSFSYDVYSVVMLLRVCIFTIITNITVKLRYTLRCIHHTPDVSDYFPAVTFIVPFLHAPPSRRVGVFPWRRRYTLVLLQTCVFYFFLPFFCCFRFSRETRDCHRTSRGRPVNHETFLQAHADTRPRRDYIHSIIIK